MASTWNHDGDPVEVLRVEEHVQRLRACLRDNPKYLQEKVAHYLQVWMHTYLNLCFMNTVFTLFRLGEYVCNCMLQFVPSSIGRVSKEDFVCT